MSGPFSFPTKEEIASAKVSLSEWLEFCSVLIEHLKINWKNKGIFAQYVNDDEAVHIIRDGGYGKIYRKGERFWVHFPSSIQLKELDPEYEYLSYSKTISGWQEDEMKCEDMLGIVDIALRDFVRVSEKLHAANIAIGRLEDIQNGYSEYD